MEELRQLLWAGMSWVCRGPDSTGTKPWIMEAFVASFGVTLASMDARCSDGEGRWPRQGLLLFVVFL